uniref:Uncharacterized protein n=1 Tax=Oryzias latipes TaxID=8090 RepID=A0A3B3H5W5_ORYLA
FLLREANTSADLSGGFSWPLVPAFFPSPQSDSCCQTRTLYFQKYFFFRFPRQTTSHIN